MGSDRGNRYRLAALIALISKQPSKLLRKYKRYIFEAIITFIDGDGSVNEKKTVLKRPKNPLN